MIRLRLAGVATEISDAVLYRYLEYEGSVTMNYAARQDPKTRQEQIAIAKKYMADERLPPSLAGRFRGWIAAEEARLALGIVEERDWAGAWQHV